MITVDHNNLAIEMLPPDKRAPIQQAWIQALVAPMVRLETLRNSYVFTTTYSAWSSSATVTKGSLFSYNNAIYENQTGVNTATTPDNDSVNWLLVQANFIGVNDRILYNGQTLVLTYALNEWFAQYGTIFRQPSAVSDIYLVTNAFVFPSFLIAPNEANTSLVAPTFSTGWIRNTLVVDTTAALSIMVPNTVLSSIPGGATAVAQFAGKYIAAGISFTVQGY